MIRMALTVQGQVQGVGFRPFVWRLARDEKLTGFVGNTSAGVRIEIQGSPLAIGAFSRRLRQELPPLARITHLEQQELPLAAEEKYFVIVQSRGHAGQNVLVSADVAVCADCLADMADPVSMRYHYAFTNCTNCGPRFSITRSIPYDRAGTTMSCFPLCEDCASEYTNPANRRFHAQPIACPACGPQLWYVDKDDILAGNTAPTIGNSRNALAKAAELIKRGGILALRGLGGFQLVCDARSPAVNELRRRKGRPHKALAVMMRTLADVASCCHLTDAHETLLTGSAKPIVLCPVRAEMRHMLRTIAPDCATMGVMLPYTPLHALLLDELAQQGPPCLIMTSANPQGEPITLGNREALSRLHHLADAWLLHNRDILCRIDDSVVAVDSRKPVFLRRARGYVPEPVQLPASGPCVLGMGAELKATFSLTRGANAFPGQHIGDLKNIACLDFYGEALSHLQTLLEVRPELIVHDLHPDFLSTQKARELASQLHIPTLPLQHHVAHAASCLGEHGILSPSLALCLDGSGLGDDGVIWGGELLLVDLSRPGWKRLGSLVPFYLPGGDMAIEHPWRIATALKWQRGENNWQMDVEEGKLVTMLERRINCPLTTSCGRLFDAVAAQLNLCRAITYEAQGAIRLEKAASLWQRQYPGEAWLAEDFAPVLVKDNFFQLDSLALFSQVEYWQHQEMDSGLIAFSFHHWLATGFAALAAQAAAKYHIGAVALSGGVMQNALMRRLLRQRLCQLGLQPLMHSNPGDGGISLGQAFWGQRLLASGGVKQI